MSDLADIAAAAGIVIVDTAPGDGGDADCEKNTCRNDSVPQVPSASCESGDAMLAPEVAAMDALFGHRYTMDDPDYAQVVNEAEATSRPPCVQDYRESRPRDDNRRRGGRGYGRGNYHGNRSYQERGDNYYRERGDNYHNNRSYRDRDDNRSWHHRDGGDGRERYRHDRY